MKHRLLIATAATVCVLVMTGGCTMNNSEPGQSPTDAAEPAPTGSSLYDDARATYTSFRSATNLAQQELFDGEWRVGSYGDFPEVCMRGDQPVEGTYRFVASAHLNTETGGLPEYPEQSVQTFAAWLTEQGWSEVGADRLSLTNGTTLSLTATNPERDVEHLALAVRVDTAGTPVSVTFEVQSVCGDGDSAALVGELFPPAATGIEVKTVVPSEDFRFGFDESGEPVMLRADHAS